jgi:hypothetical protein
MGCGCYAAKAAEDSGSGGVEVLVGDAEDAAVADSTEVMPVALCDNAFEGDTIPCPAPGEEEDLGLIVFGE